MKILKPTLIFLLICHSSLSGLTQKKLALIVAISTYPVNQRAWKNLSSYRDLQYIRAALIKNKFDSSNIAVLTNKNATKDAMIKSLDALIEKAALNDIVYFHFSGHGQQIQDSKTDGIFDEADGYDEALIPYDAKGKWDPVDYHGEKHFRDDLLGEKLNKLRIKVGVNGSVIAVIDACHSGTATRSLGKFRGVPEPCQQYGYQPNTTLDLSKNVSIGLLDKLGENMGSLVVFSGSSPNQLNKETKDDYGNGVGSLSYSFAKAISTLPANSNYQLLFEKVKATIQADEPTQIPMFEGNGALKVFSNQYIPLREIIRVVMPNNNVKNGFNDTTFIIDRGLYHNINIGTTLLIHKLDEKLVFTKAIVKEVNDFESLCVAEKKMPNTNSYEAKIDAISYGVIAASYYIKNKTNKVALEKQLNTFLQPQPFLTLNNNPDYTIIIEQEKDKYAINLIEKNDSIKYLTRLSKNDTLSQIDLDQILENIKHGMRVKYLRKMQDGGNLMKDVKVEIVPLKKSASTSELVFFSQDEFSLVITSNYENELYYTVLDLLPNNDVKVLIPDSLKLAENYSLKKGGSISIPIIVDETSLTGKEVLKVFFSPKALDLRASFEKNVTRRGSAKPLEKMLDDLFPKDKKTSTRAGTVKMDGIAIVTVGFTVRKR